MSSLRMLRGLFKKSESLLKNSNARFFHRSSNLSARVSYKLSDIGEGIREVLVKEWYVKEGDKVAQFDNICEVQSDKASVTITSRYDGVVAKLHYNIDDVALVGKPLVDIETDQDVPEELQAATQVDDVKEEKVEVHPVEYEEKSDVQVSTIEILTVPSVRRLAKEHRLDLSRVKGTGKHGRITKEDVLKYIDSLVSQKPEGTAPSVKPFNIALTDEAKPVSGFQKAMVKTMTESLKIPHFGYCDEFKVTKLSELRKTLRSSPDIDMKISFLPFFIKAVSNSLLRHPVLNASLDEKCENVLYHKNHNIGVAMDTTSGLAVPVIKEVENKSVTEISSELIRLMKSGKSGNFVPSDLTGGTFTVSNIGSIGGTYTKPVILAPQVAIIAIGASQIVPRFDVAQNVTAEEIVQISASGDHRIIDGATMAKFMNIVKRQIESPYLLLLNV